MGGLAHYLEAAGIATTQISLVRLHTEKTRPPRALWVSFELGRPFGPPDNAEFQRAVVRAALSLLEADSGPLIEDYPTDAPVSAGEQSGWACPIKFAKAAEDLAGPAAIEQILNAEIAQLQPWYDRAVASRGRTTVGLSGLDGPAIARLYGAMFDGPLPACPRDDLDLADTLRLAAEDLKAFYFEAASAQPGEATATQLSDWFWHDTRAGDVLRQMKARLISLDDEALQLLGRALMVPLSAV